MGLEAKKHLGQHFLKSKAATNAMIDSALIDSHDIVVEAGPGKGALTEDLFKCAREVIAIEKDPRMSFYLQNKFKSEIASEKLRLVTGDVLDFNPESFSLKNGGYKIAANIPYYITGQFIRHFLTNKIQPSAMVLLLQKEVVERICAKDGKESILSLSVKAYGTPSYIQTVPAEMFSPAPKVDSAILLISRISKDSFRKLDENRFFEVIKAGFAQKRKKASSNLSKIWDKKLVQELFSRLELNDNARAEEIPLSKWKSLASSL